MKTVLSSVEQFNSIVDALVNNPDNFELSPELFRFEIKISGDEYKSTLDGNLIQGLADLQVAIYRAYAAIKFAAEGSKKLTNEEKENLRIWITVSPGCTELSGILKQGKLFLRELAKMDKHVALALTGTVAIGLCLWAGCWIYSEHAEVQKHQATLDAIVKACSQSSAFQVTNTAREELAKGQREFLKSASGASSVVIGGAVTFSANDIKELNRRASGEDAQIRAFSEICSIYQINNKDPNKIKLSVFCVENPSEEYVVRVDNDFFLDEEDISSLWSAAKNRSKVKMQLIEAKKKSGVIYSLGSFEILK